MIFKERLISLRNLIHSKNFFLVSFLLILCIGIFLRTYHFHDWLLFEKDQVRDAVFTEQVLTGEKSWPVFGPTMRASGEDKETLFHIGPVYYYFQILSAMIFGPEAEVMAYPDLLFSILSLPLFFFFLRKYFTENISLALMGVYAISFFIIKYSRFAWNPNLIPFFSLLFLFSAHEFLINKEKTRWFWVVSYAIALGIGVQLHATTLILFSAVFIVTTLFLFYKNRGIWKKIFVIIFLALCINAPQVVSEFSTGFTNTRILFHFSEKNDTSKTLSHKTTSAILADTLSCHLENNAYIFFSLGNKDCSYSFVKVLEKSPAGNRFRSTVSWIGLLGIFFFSFLGYISFWYKFFQEEDRNKKYFLGLLISFFSLFFVIMIPIVGGSEFKEFRYFSPVFFVAFFFVGFFIEWFVSSRKLKYAVLFLLVGVASIGNIQVLADQVTILSSYEGNNGHAVYYGEVENIVKYMQEMTGSARKIYVMSEKIYTGNIFLPGAYVARKTGYELIRTFEIEDVPLGSPLFFLAINRGENELIIRGLPVKSVKNFGKMRVYQLEY